MHKGYYDHIHLDFDVQKRMNWDEHRRIFNELNKTHGISIKDYAEQNGLNYNSARRQLKVKTDHSGDQSPDQPINSKGDRPSKLGETPQPITPKERPKKPGSAGAATDAPATGGAGTKAPRKKKKKDLGNVVPLRDRGVYREKGDQTWKAGATAIVTNGAVTIENGDDKPKRRPLRTGIYQKVTPLDVMAALDKIAEPGYIERVELDALATAVARRDMLVSVQQGTMAELEIQRDMYNGVIGPEDPQWDSNLGALLENPMFRMYKVSVEGGYALADAARTISQIHTNIVKTRLAEHKQRFLMEDTPRLIAEAMDKQEADGLSAVETVRWLERQGVKPPVTLLAAALKELKEDDGLDDDGETMTTVDQETIDKEARAYKKMRESKDEFLKERRAQVAAVVDKFGYGDIDANGQRREGEGLSEYDDEELDMETLHQQYEEDGADQNWEDDE